ncbi:Uncharacterised protein [Shewanella putrefaciens]|nr:Uncharacterised protein [Shewanella putrefaciens]
MTHQYISPFGLVLLLRGSMERKGLSAHAKDGNATVLMTARKNLPNKKDAYLASFLLRSQLIVFVSLLQSQLTLLRLIIGGLDLI